MCSKKASFLLKAVQGSIAFGFFLFLALLLFAVFPNIFLGNIMEYFRLLLIWSLVILSFFTSKTTSDKEVDPKPSSGPGYGLIQRNALVSKKFPVISDLFELTKLGDLQQSGKDSVLDDQYKPWGAASLPHPNPENQVILDKVDDDLFTPNSEVHTYDQQRFRYQS